MPPMNTTPLVSHSLLPYKNPHDPLKPEADGDHLVLVLNDNYSILRSMKRLLGANGYSVRLHTEAEDFFRVGIPSVASCLLLDNELGNHMTGMEVYAEVQRLNWNLPTVFVTTHWSVQSVVQAMRLGADDFLATPYSAADLLASVARALQRSRTQHHDRLQVATARIRAATLTQREREIVRMVATGLRNKEIADHLNVALITVKIHRSRAMRKLGAGNTAELASIASLTGILDPRQAEPAEAQSLQGETSMWGTRLERFA